MRKVKKMSNKIVSFLSKYAAPIVLSIVLIGMIISVKAGCGDTSAETLEQTTKICQTSARSVTYTYIVTNNAGFISEDVAKCINGLSQAFIDTEESLSSGNISLDNARDNIVSYVNELIDKELKGNTLIKQLATILIYDGFKRLEELTNEELSKADTYVKVINSIRLGLEEGARDAGVKIN